LLALPEFRCVGPNVLDSINDASFHVPQGSAGRGHVVMGSGFEENITEVTEQITEIHEDITDVQVQAGNVQVTEVQENFTEIQENITEIQQ
jgi:hypothetical protein